jgi:hypothetical protein
MHMYLILLSLVSKGVTSEIEILQYRKMKSMDRNDDHFSSELTTLSSFCT